MNFDLKFFSFKTRLTETIGSDDYSSLTALFQTNFHYVVLWVRQFVDPVGGECVHLPSRILSMGGVFFCSFITLILPR